MSLPDGYPTPEQLLEEEARLQLPSLSEADAIEIGTRLLALATQRSLPVAIEVWRGSRLIFRAARPGTNAHNDMYLAGKLRVVQRFGHSSFHERLRHVAAGTTFADATGLAFPEYAPHGGGVPLSVAGTGPVGVAIVSGLPQEQDHALVVEAIEAFLAARG